jgi:hypothetical protein
MNNKFIIGANMFKKLSFTLSLAAVLIFTDALLARSFRVAQIPNGSVNGCANCHVSAGGGGTRTAFGALVLSSYLDGSGNVLWGPELAAADADGDGYSNGHELEDPFGVWTSGSSAPGETGLVSNPGLSTSSPPVNGQPLSLHFSLEGMTPHAGQLFQVRIEDSSNDEQVAFSELASIPGSDFDFTFMHTLTAGHSYNLEFWSDHNGNGVYDPPPTDHAWRISLGEISSNHIESFTHNTDFTDIGSPLDIDDRVLNPTDWVLYDNYPNPFNPSTKLSFFMDNAGQVELSVYNLRGERVAQVYSGVLSAGSHEFSFNAQSASGNPLPAGIYLYRVQVGTEVQTKRMTLLK